MSKIKYNKYFTIDYINIEWVEYVRKDLFNTETLILMDIESKSYVDYIEVFKKYHKNVFFTYVESIYNYYRNLGIDNIYHCGCTSLFYNDQFYTYKFNTNKNGIIRIDPGPARQNIYTNKYKISQFDRTLNKGFDTFIKLLQSHRISYLSPLKPDVRKSVYQSYLVGNPIIFPKGYKLLPEYLLTDKNNFSYDPYNPQTFDECLKKCYEVEASDIYKDFVDMHKKEINKIKNIINIGDFNIDDDIVRFSMRNIIDENLIKSLKINKFKSDVISYSDPKQFIGDCID